MSIREELRTISLNVGATATTTTITSAKRSMSSGASSMSSSMSMFASQHNASNDELSQHEMSTFASISLNDKSRENNNPNLNNNSTIGKITDSFVSQARENLRQNIDSAARDLFANDENQENVRPAAATVTRSPFKSTKYFVKSDPALKQVLETLNQMNYQLSKIIKKLIKNILIIFK